ncbi:site-specific integrase [Blastococcus tunisiensis]|uniref:Phage integrase family protein n=1 Tax=Blastococcus tunisiensis TaxID=1798228 RepID=A0A1I2EIH7_9ACTN|nr:site-specific integrase [Blastococcus sp. DSM 46838]SFE92493.1 Phage integrase family protein [Blastococcus sp. DSM 46838]
MRLLAYTGLRFGEMAALRIRRIDFLRRRLTIAEAVTEVGGRLEFGTPKTHQQRTVPLPAALAELLARRCEGKHGEDLLMTTASGTVLRLRNWRRAVFDPASRAAGLANVTPHDLRHTAASLAVASGATVKSVQRMLGHASAAMTLDVYSGLFDDLTALADRMDAATRAAAETRVCAVWARPLADEPARDKRPGEDGGPRGDRTLNPRLKSPRVRAASQCPVHLSAVLRGAHAHALTIDPGVGGELGRGAAARFDGDEVVAPGIEAAGHTSWIGPAGRGRCRSRSAWCGHAAGTDDEQ